MLRRPVHLNLIPLFVPVAPLDSNGTCLAKWQRLHPKGHRCPEVVDDRTPLLDTRLQNTRHPLECLRTARCAIATAELTTHHRRA
jgi:hypothetical protein